MLTQESFSEQQTNYHHCKVLIVGGGPAGLAAALMLAKLGWKNITVIEQRAAADYYEPDKSFNYLIDGRGQKFTDLLGLTEKLLEIGVPSTEFYLTSVKPNGSKKTSKLPTENANRKTAYWLPRKAFVLLLYQEIERNWTEFITVIFNASCVKINRLSVNNQKEEKLEVFAKVENGSIVRFEPDFLVGCDGLHSIVRNTLKEWDKSTSNKFEMKLFPSASSGLRYKVLSLLPNFQLDHSAKERAVSDMAYAIRSAFKDKKKALSLGLLPLKNPDEFRNANIITKVDHEIWKLKNSQEIYQFFEQAFPQLPISKIVLPEELERFAKSGGGYFPIPQYCSGLHFLLKAEQNTELEPGATKGILLLGDAIHCFPPDIGQGVNSALEDVYLLYQELSKNNDISHTLPVYESLRAPDVKALVHLAQFAFPWQYNQDKFRKNLWTVNFIFRLILSRLLPYIFSPPAFFMIQNHQLSYHEILGMAQRTTKLLYVIGLSIICGFLAVVELGYLK